MDSGYAPHRQRNLFKTRGLLELVRVVHLYEKVAILWSDRYNYITYVSQSTAVSSVCTKKHKIHTHDINETWGKAKCFIDGKGFSSPSPQYQQLAMGIMRYVDIGILLDSRPC